MIESLSGTVRRVAEGGLSLEVGGVGFALRASAATVAGLPPVGSPATLATRLLTPREDAPALYGFATEEEAGLFDQIRSISGVGPAVALQLLAIGASTLREGVRSRDVKLLCAARGVGPKLARRLIAELADALPEPDEAPAGKAADPERERLVSAFLNLQFADRRRVEAVADEIVAAMPDADLASRLRVGLSKLTGRG